jgi:large conductance mechanosensitive channel
MIKEFLDFIKRGSVIDLAVAFILGGAFGAIVSSLVNDLIMPLIGVIIGGINFTGLILKIGSAEVKYGNFLQALVNFLIISLTIFFLVKAVNRFKRKEPPAPPKAPAEEIVLLTQIRDELRNKQI